MHILIISLPLHTNIGGILQSYALQTVLSRNGHDAIVLNRPFCSKPSVAKVLAKACCRLLKKMLGRETVPLFYDFKHYKEYTVISQHTEAFIEKNIHCRYYKRYTDIREADWDALVVGSDQIWRRNFNQKIENVFFDFAWDWKNVRRIAYAPSFGLDTWGYSDVETKNCAGLVKKYNLVTVREESAVGLCEKHLGVKPMHVLDPTMLLDRKDYEALTSEVKEKSDGDMLVYLLDPMESNLVTVKEVSAVLHHKPFYVFSKVNDTSLPLSERIQIPVEKWLKGFQDAKFVITDSFHGCIFSIIFNVPFVVLRNEQGGLARIYSLLSMFCLKDRLVDSVDDLKQLKIIDWNKVNAIREKKKYFALGLIDKILR